MNTKQLAAFRWWDTLTISQQAWYGQMFPKCKSTRDLIETAYEELKLKKGAHLRVVK